MNNPTKTRASGPIRIVRWKAFYLVVSVSAILTIYAHFFFDEHLRQSVEMLGSNLNQAQVNIAGLKTHLLNGEIAITNIEITDPDDAMTNLLSLDQVKIKVRLEPLLRKKLVIDRMEVSGVHYHSERRASGLLTSDEPAIRGVPTLIERVSTSFYAQLRDQLAENPLRSLGTLLSGMDLATKISQSKTTLSSVQNVSKIRQELERTESTWNSLLAEMPSADSIIAAQDQIKKLRGSSSSPAEHLKAFKSMGERLGQLSSQSRKAWEKMATEAESIQGDFDQFTPLLDKDVHTLESQLKLPRLDFSDLSPLVFGPRLLNDLERLTYWIDLSRRRMPLATHVGTVAVIRQQRGAGVSIDFYKRAAYPSFLLYELVVHSDPSPSDPSLGKVDAKLEGLTSDPAIYGRPLTVSMSADFPNQQIVDFEMTGSIDHTTDIPREKLELSAVAVPLSEFVINDSGDVQLVIASADLKFKASLEFAGSDAKCRLKADVADASFRVSSRFKEIESTIGDILNPLTSFELDGKLEGTPDKLNYLMESEFGKKLATGLHSEFKHQIGAIEDDLRKNILDEVYPDQQALTNRYTELREKTFIAAQSRMKSIQDLLSASDRELARLGNQ
jgi:uncharacterized protein (TIGR03545 family)